MDVRCPKCQSVYEVDDAQFSSRAVTFKCSQCEHMFRLESSATADQENAVRWMIRAAHSGELLYCANFRLLHRWIMEGKVGQDDQISRTGIHWRTLGSIGEFIPVFQAADSIAEASLQASSEASERFVVPVPPSLFPAHSSKASVDETAPDASAPEEVISELESLISESESLFCDSESIVATQEDVADSESEPAQSQDEVYDDSPSSLPDEESDESPAVVEDQGRKRSTTALQFNVPLPEARPPSQVDVAKVPVAEAREVSRVQFDRGVLERVKERERRLSEELQSVKVDPEEGQDKVDQQVAEASLPESKQTQAPLSDVVITSSEEQSGEWRMGEFALDDDASEPEPSPDESLNFDVESTVETGKNKVWGLFAAVVVGAIVVVGLWAMTSNSSSSAPEEREVAEMPVEEALAQVEVSQVVEVAQQAREIAIGHAHQELPEANQDQKVAEAESKVVEEIREETKKAPSPPPRLQADQPRESSANADLSTLLANAKRALESGNHDRASQLYRAALEREPGNPAAETGLGWAHLAQGTTKLAISQFKGVLERSPSYGDAYIGLGRAMRQEGDLRAARRAYEDYLKQLPDGPQASIARYQSEQLAQALGE